MKSLCLLAAHVAYPETVLSDDFLCRLVETDVSKSFLDEKCTQRRHSVLSPEYIESTKNRDWWNAGSAKLSPTDLGYEAVFGALEKAKVDPAEVGLLLASTLTPLETCPAEATRIASKLELKIPAFDVVCGEVSLLGMVETLLNWRYEDLPSTIVCVSSHAPSRFIDFSRPEGLVLGDGAAALVLSKKDVSEFFIERSWTSPLFSGEAQFSLDIFSPVSLHSLRLPDVEADIAYFQEALSSFESPVECLTVTTSRTDRKKLLHGLSGSTESSHHFDVVEKYGFSFDVSLVAQFLARQEEIRPGSSVALIMPHVNSFRGGLVVTRRGCE
jgi:hypothetical protein